MQANVKFSSRRFFLSLMLSSCAVILLQNYNIAENTSFTFNSICIFAGLAISALFFIPSIIIKKKTDSDFLKLSQRYTLKAKIPLAVFYSLYFIYVAEFFLLPYTDMFHTKYYSDASPLVICILLLACCVYAAYKGANVISRFGIFLFLFALLTNILIMGGSITSLDFKHYGFEIKGGASELLQNIVYFATPSFIAVIFACLSSYTKNFKFRQPFVSLLITGIKYSLVTFFIWFALGDYSARQDYQTFMLSRVAHFATFGGIESFYLALATMSVFMIISLLLCCITKSLGSNGELRNIIIFTAIIFVLYVTAVYNNSIQELLLNPLIFILLTFIAAVVIPTVYIFIWRKSNARKA